MLYNLDKARKSIRKLDEIVLLEGFMDVIKSDTAGLKNVVATMGTQLSDEHITFIRKLTSNITLMFDGILRVVKQHLKQVKICYSKG